MQGLRNHCAQLQKQKILSDVRNKISFYFVAAVWTSQYPVVSASLKLSLCHDYPPSVKFIRSNVQCL